MEVVFSKDQGFDVPLKVGAEGYLEVSKDPKPGSLAAKAGVKKGHFVATVNGEPLPPKLTEKKFQLMLVFLIQKEGVVKLWFETSVDALAGLQSMTDVNDVGLADLTAQLLKLAPTLAMGWAANDMLKGKGEEEEGGSETSDPLSLEEITQARERWEAAAQSLDPAALASLYHPTGRLLGTLDQVETNEYRCTPDRVIDYFYGFLNTKNLSVDWLHPVTQSDVIQLGPGTASYSGYYHFTRGEAHIRAKFTFIYKRVPGSPCPLILLHNSGAVPVV